MFSGGGVVRVFVQSLAKRLAPSNPEWAAAASMLAAMGRMRAPSSVASLHLRALPKQRCWTSEVAHPSSPRNLSRGIKRAWELGSSSTHAAGWAPS